MARDAGTDEPFACLQAQMEDLESLLAPPSHPAGNPLNNDRFPPFFPPISQNRPT
jgi:hypothetical protein